MNDYLDVLAGVAQVTIEDGYYDCAKQAESKGPNLRKATNRMIGG